ncbi:hypothetical protein [Methylobacterium sp. A54F]
MSKISTDAGPGGTQDRARSPEAPWPGAGTPAGTLSPGVRRHLGQTLRTHFAESLAAPVGPSMERLLAQLDHTKG